MNLLAQVYTVWEVSNCVNASSEFVCAT